MSTQPVTVFTIPTGTRVSVFVSNLEFEAGGHSMQVDGEEQQIEATATDDFKITDGVRYRCFSDVEPEIRNLDNSIWLVDATLE
jgi:hypothetical protein